MFPPDASVNVPDASSVSVLPELIPGAVMVVMGVP